MKSNRLIAGLMVGAAFLATSLTAPAQAQSNNKLLNQQAMQMYQQNLLNQQYAQNGQYGQYGYGGQVGAYGLNPNDPQYFQKAQYQQWLQSQGGNRGGMGMNQAQFNQGFTNSQFNPARFNKRQFKHNNNNNNNGWNGQAYRMNSNNRFNHR